MSYFELYLNSLLVNFSVARKPIYEKINGGAMRPTGLLLFVIIVLSRMELQQHYLLDIQSSAI